MIPGRDMDALHREIQFAVSDVSQAANAVALFASSSIDLGKTEIGDGLRVRVHAWRAAVGRERQARADLDAAAPRSREIRA